MKQQFITLLQSEEGATALEYGLLAALIAATIASAITSIGTQINTVFSSLSSIMIAAISG